ncbi:hypothetical protein BOX15_Mlig023704g2 [Macrostomum lignano]|uniref:Uncharacterized protein n=2 Tax=Macrostomum lignano TaxID=282301 RepID=A0A267GEG6_9PLAT|nr:hypothetical protein BOX15_Mlig023704g2 [Macrostomum lignano]
MEVTRQSFESDLATILDSISSADFVAIDGEYTGIETASARRSFFDTPAERYAKCRAALRQSAVLEFGLAAFRRVSVGDGGGFDNQWEARVFNVPLYPATFEPLGREFVCTAASLEFLRRHGLDLNRVVDCGVYYLNEAQEAQLRRLLNAGGGSGGTGVEPLGAADECELAAEAERISNLLSAAPDPSAEVRIPVRRIGCVSSLGVRVALAARLQRPADGCQLLLRCEPPVGGNLGQTGDGYCRAEAAAADTIQPDGCVLWVVRQRQDSTSAAVVGASDDVAETESFALRCVGFSRVFRALVNLRKPLVGHNCFLDLLAMYEYFYRPLPVDYEAWKAESFHRLTPLVWDTKHLLYEFRSACKFNSLPIGSLEEARDALTALDAAGGAGSAPTIRQLGLAESSATSGGGGGGSWAAAHRAGWDAFMAGEVFLRVSHRMLLLSLRPPATAVSAVSSDSGGVEFVRRPSFAAYRRVLESRANCVNLIKAKQHCVKLDAPDPKSRRPPVLVLRRWDGGPIDLLWVRDLVAIFGLAGLRSLNSGRQILIAMSSFAGARDLAKELADSEEFWLEPHSRLRHSLPLRLAIWMGTAGFTALALRSVVKIAKRVL